MTNHRRNDHGLTRRSKLALILLEEARGEPGVLSNGPTAMLDGQAWIHWRTAYALQARGLVKVTGQGEEAEVRFA